jgi:hypothetical protein
VNEKKKKLTDQLYFIILVGFELAKSENWNSNELLCKALTHLTLHETKITFTKKIKLNNIIRMNQRPALDAPQNRKFHSHLHYQIEK